jgi:hypothetical protein
VVLPCARLRLPGEYVFFQIDRIPVEMIALFRGEELRRSMVDGEEHVELEAPAASVRRRLALFGQTAAVAEQAFEASRAGFVDLHAGHARQVADQGEAGLADKLDVAAAYARSLTFADWARDAGIARRASLTGDAPPFPRDFSTLRKIGAWVGDDLALRMYVETCAPEEPVTLELTGLVASGVVDPSRLDRSWPVSWWTADGVRYAPVVVLTEGPTDVEFLRAAFELLYPDLDGYIRFYDYGVDTAGGAAKLTGVVRAFAAAGVANRVVALYDADAAGTAEIERLAQVELPYTIQVCQYPEIPLHRAYPVRRDDRAGVMDIWRAAAAIETYLGEDVLRARPGGGLAPVRWRPGAANQAVDGKGRIQARFREKVRRAKAAGGPLPGQDWSGLDAILQTILDVAETAPLAPDGPDPRTWAPRHAEHPFG